jgi:cytochrome b6-f complex iron-sulfur subunit
MSQVPPKPPPPTKKVDPEADLKPKEKTPEAISRRKFFLTVGWWAFWGTLASATLATLRFFFPNVLFEPPTRFKVGFPQEYEIGAVSTKWLKKYQVWVVRNKEGMYAIQAICTHLGCTPAWLSAENKFKCPCHGSGFKLSGVNFEGPAPRPLERVGIALAGDGQILLDRGKIFRFEKGEWGRSEAFLRV